jgi:hypothetical protein
MASFGGARASSLLVLTKAKNQGRKSFFYETFSAKNSGIIFSFKIQSIKQIRRTVSFCLKNKWFSPKNSFKLPRQNF